jgi:hypothetical protein
MVSRRAQKPPGHVCAGAGASGWSGWHLQYHDLRRPRAAHC